MAASLMTSPDIPVALRQRAFDCYVHHRAMPMSAIAALLEVSPRTFWTLRRKWGWPPRKAAREAALAAPHLDVEARPVAGTSLREAAASLARVTHGRLDALIRDQATVPEIDHDKTARILAGYAKTLTIARSLLDQEGATPDESEADAYPARSLDELRDELARHLERVVAEEEARGGDGLLV